MIQLPPEPTRGTDILPWAVEAQRVMRRLRLRVGPGLMLEEGGNNQRLRLAPSLEAMVDFPFRLRPAQDADGNPGCAISPGTVGGVTPLAAGESLAGQPAPVHRLQEAGTNVVAIKVAWLPQIAVDFLGTPYLVTGGSLEGPPEIVSFLEADWPADESLPDAVTGAAGVFFQRIGTVEVTDAMKAARAYNDTLRSSLNVWFDPPGGMVFQPIT